MALVAPEGLGELDDTPYGDRLHPPLHLPNVVERPAKELGKLQLGETRLASVLGKEQPEVPEKPALRGGRNGHRARLARLFLRKEDPYRVPFIGKSDALLNSDGRLAIGEGQMRPAVHFSDARRQCRVSPTTRKWSGGGVDTGGVYTCVRRPRSNRWMAWRGRRVRSWKCLQGEVQHWAGGGARAIATGWRAGMSLRATVLPPPVP